MKALAHAAVLALLICICPGGSQPAWAADAVLPADAIAVKWGERIPARDGAVLAATIYRPRDAGPLPVIFMPTPYIADSYHDRAMYFARRGYVFALIDVRGRGNSSADFEPFLHDANDGYDAVEWLAAQPWSDGKVAMWGGSYGGFVQWATARTRPPHLRTIVPVASVHPGVDYPYHQNRMNSYVMRWLTFTSGHTPNDNLFGENPVFNGAFRQLYMQHLPFASLDTVLGNPSATFQLWLEHPTLDAFWDSLTPSAAEYAAIDLPILTITGYYDGDQLGALGYYRKHLRAAGEAARQRHYFIIGPWNHAGTRTPKREFGGLVFGENSLLDLEELHRQWYDWTLKDGPKPQFLKAPVAYYVPGDGSDEWKYAESLETVATSTRTLYLDSVNGRANDVFHSGDLREHAPAPGSKPDGWVYDPLDTRPGMHEQPDDALPGYLNQHDALMLYGAGVVYHTAPFEQAVEITGQARATLYLAMDVPDTDVFVDLYEILADGKSIELTGASLRARYRDSLREATPVPSGQVLPYEFEHFQYFSRRIAKGSRLRLVIRSPNSIHTQKNYNSGGVVARETATDARTAHISLHHDATYPSRIVLPVVQPAIPSASAQFSQPVSISQEYTR